MSKQCEISCSVPSLENTDACDCSNDTPVTFEVGKKSSPAKSVLGQALGSALMLEVACLACCASLIAPVILGLVAGTPLAALLTFSSGWLVGGLAFLLVVAGCCWYGRLVVLQEINSNQSVEQPCGNLRFWRLVTPAEVLPFKHFTASAFEGLIVLCIWFSVESVECHPMPVRSTPKSAQTRAQALLEAERLVILETCAPSCKWPLAS
jgi:hypothetical protein